MADPPENPPPPLPPSPQSQVHSEKPEKKKIPIQWMEKTSARRVTLKKRRESIMKKSQELQRKCNVDVVAIVYSPGDDVPLVYPARRAAQTLCSRFMQLPADKRDFRARTHLQFLEETLEKKQKKIREKLAEIEEKETRQMVYKALAGGDIADIDSITLRKMLATMDKMHAEVALKRTMAAAKAPVAEVEPPPPPEHFAMMSPPAPLDDAALAEVFLQLASDGGL